MFLRSIIFCLFLPFQSLSQVMPQPFSDDISDLADLLPGETEARIGALLADGRAETGVHVTLVTMEHIADYGGAGQRIEDYAKALFNQWGVGGAQRNDGILILVSRGDREMRISLGAGYSVIWDNAAQSVVDSYFLPEFRADRYAEGIEAGVAGTYDQIVRRFVAHDPPPEPQGSSAGPAQVIFSAILVISVVLVALRQRLPNLAAQFRRCPKCGHRGLSQSRRTINNATTNATGNGEIRRSCQSCGDLEVMPYVISIRSTDTGSSGGFDGGSSSGGGASGKW